MRSPMTLHIGLPSKLIGSESHFWEENDHETDENPDRRPAGNRSHGDDRHSL